MLALVLVAASVGFSNLAASIGIGAGGIGPGTRLRVIVIFGVLEAGMPVIGLVVGHGLASSIGEQADWIAAVLLVAVGGYGIVKSVRSAGLSAIRAWFGGSSRAQRRPAERHAAERRPAGAATTEHRPAEPRPAGPGRPAGGARQTVQLAISGIALSMDNLVAGFALGTYQVNLIAGALVFGVVSIAMSLAGLEFGARIGRAAGESGELIGGVVLVGVGVAVGLGVLG
ncbi:MAG TPA: manganese efflux pump [Streptosporangiaceae bacterium]|nr:manganese efflux pump [Streptosporangiaceae bacterium]